MKRNIRQIERLNECEHLFFVYGCRQLLVTSIKIRVDLTSIKGPSTVKKMR